MISEDVEGERIDKGCDNHIRKIKEVYMFISEDSKGEGICAVQMGNDDDMIMMPLIGADKERIESLEKYAAFLAKKEGKRIKLIKLTQREDLRYVNG